MGYQINTLEKHSEVLDLIRKNIRIIKKDECEYLNGWNDVRLAKHLGVTTGVVRHMRLKHFGWTHTHTYPYYRKTIKQEKAMATPSTGKKQTIDRMQVIDMYEKLKTILVKHEDDIYDGRPTVSYIAPWNDELVAKEFNCSFKSVENLRNQKFGCIRGSVHRQSVSKDSLLKMDQRLTDIEAYLTRTDPNWRLT
jgi:hypothetical protein